MAKRRKVRVGDPVRVNHNWKVWTGVVIAKRAAGLMALYDIECDDGTVLKDQVRPSFRILPSHMTKQ